MSCNLLLNRILDSDSIYIQEKYILIIKETGLQANSNYFLSYKPAK